MRPYVGMNGKQDGSYDAAYSADIYTSVGGAMRHTCTVIVLSFCLSVATISRQSNNKNHFGQQGLLSSAHLTQ